MEKPSISVGISAYNEEANIGFLLQSLLKQKIKRATLKEIIVISDGSTDNTIKKVSSVKSKLVRLKVYKNRKGLYARQNEITKLSKSNILILMDADVLPANENFIEEIIKPIVNMEKVGIVSGETNSLQPRGLIERVLSEGHQIKQEIYKKINHGDTVYLCHGRARAFSKKLYSQMNWPEDLPEDSYSYFFCISKGFKFVFNPKAKVIFRPPSKISEYVEKNKRFRAGKKKLEKHFPISVLNKSFNLPKVIIAKTLFSHIFSKPFITLTYLTLLTLTRVLTNNERYKYSSLWKVSKTSKILVNEK